MSSQNNNSGANNSESNGDSPLVKVALVLGALAALAGGIFSVTDGPTDHDPMEG